MLHEKNEYHLIVEKRDAILNVAKELAENYNDVNEKIMKLNKYQGHEHVSSENQMAILNAFYLECIHVLSNVIDVNLVDKNAAYDDVKKYEAQSGLKSISLESQAIAHAVFNAMWIKYLMLHCGRPKLGWYLATFDLLLEGMSTYNIKEMFTDDTKDVEPPTPVKPTKSPIESVHKSKKRGRFAL